jgi:hypothetical protein
MRRYRGALKAILDEIEKSERAIIGSLEHGERTRRKAVRRAEDERWRWIVRHSADTVFRGVTREDILLGRAE